MCENPPKSLVKIFCKFELSFKPNPKLCQEATSTKHSLSMAIKDENNKILLRSTFSRFNMPNLHHVYCSWGENPMTITWQNNPELLGAFYPNQAAPCRFFFRNNAQFDEVLSHCVPPFKKSGNVKLRCERNLYQAGEN